MSFDINTLRVSVTLLSFVAFAGIVWWAWSRRNQCGFDEAAQLPFLGEGASARGPGTREQSDE